MNNSRTYSHDEVAKLARCAAPTVRKYSQLFGILPTFQFGARRRFTSDEARALVRIVEEHRKPAEETFKVAVAG